MAIVRITVEKEIYAKNTKTEGKHAYVVALLCGGIMEDPDFHHED